MNKVMTRSQRRPAPRAAARPPARRDSGRPGGAPPRTPSGGTARTTAAGGRPPAGPGTAHRTRPADNRPGTPSGTVTRASGAVPAGQGAPAQPTATDVFAERLLAVLSGRRPVHAMLRHTLGRAYDDLVRLAEHGPLRTLRGARPVVRDIGHYEVRPGTIEAFARIRAGDRLRAMAFRLERGTDHRWRCTAVELGGPRPRPEDD
ncbi:Rv3235 family protein [Streptomyces longwoodensis]|uniref:Rv3235 family protein n=1 Tax=Streptomyces longwoodensis TaxID=68231 RepID=UPI002E7FC164|nr:Rv3235 family protein [Streptomyces longwoodensis]WUC59539.1 Rv3235 family protein [Streptomyces longwoodensis]